MRNQRVESKALSCPHQSRRAAPVRRHNVKSDVFLIPSDAAAPRQPRLICSLDVCVFLIQRVRRLAGGCIERRIHRFSTMFLGIKVNGMTPQKQETGKLEEVLIKSLSRVDAKLRFERDQRGLLPHQSRL